MVLIARLLFALFFGAFGDGSVRQHARQQRLNHDEWGRQESKQLSYEIASEFPSADAICRTAADLKKAGWHPLQRIDDDTKTESSFTHAWRSRGCVVLRRRLSGRGSPDHAQSQRWISLMQSEHFVKVAQALLVYLCFQKSARVSCVLTPPVVAEFLTRWAVRSTNDVVLDPSAGDGVF
ncbi:MAG: hypothetical protein K2Y23_01000 [Cyanobacteria bacterium]|nr:hypothetical protein [Cyanobacteriota bacterium]